MVDIGRLVNVGRARLSQGLKSTVELRFVKATKAKEILGFNCLFVPFYLSKPLSGGMDIIPKALTFQNMPFP